MELEERKVSINENSSVTNFADLTETQIQLEHEKQRRDFLESIKGVKDTRFISTTDLPPTIPNPISISRDGQVSLNFPYLLIDQRGYGVYSLKDQDDLDGKRVKLNGVGKYYEVKRADEILPLLRANGIKLFDPSIYPKLPTDEHKK